MNGSRLVLALVALLVCSGCISIRDRRAVLNSLNPAPIDPLTWSRIAGIYTGPLRADVNTFVGTRGVSVSDARLEIYGTAQHPEVFFKWNTEFSTALFPIEGRIESYTNIPERRYGVKGRARPSTHAPNEMLIKLHPNILSPTSFTYLILRFRGDGAADVDYLGHFGWRGIGTLHRQTRFPGSRR
jgi:hypothetical protein